MPIRTIRKAVILAGGWGTRFLPFSKVIPKEMLPIEGIPAIQYVVEECLASGLEDISIITRPGDHIIQSYFTQENLPLNKYLCQNRLEARQELMRIRQISNYVKFIVEEPSLRYGSAIPILQIEEHLHQEEAFAVLFADDVVLGKTPAMRELIHVFQTSSPEAVIAMQKVKFNDRSRFGRLILGRCIGRHSLPQYIVRDLIQYSAGKQSGTGYAVVSRLIVTPQIFRYLHTQESEVECDLGHAIAAQAQHHLVVGAKISGRWVTVGDPYHYLVAQQQVYKFRGTT